jgi:hypothetical protein
MKTSLLTVVAALVFAASASAAPKTVTVVMKDPGCHWFLVGGTYKTSLAVHGPVSLFNGDMAALKIVGPGGTRLDGVGKKLALAHGVYRITMVGQASDDNHLLLTVK